MVKRVITNIVLIVLVVGAVAVVYSLRNTDRISPARAAELVGAGARLVDVRTPAEFSAGHIDGAINVPVDSIATRLDEVGQRSDAVVVYCRSGARSARAKRILESEGFTDVSDLGGMDRWNESRAR